MKTKIQLRRGLLGRLLALAALSIPVGASVVAGCGDSCPGGSFTSTQCFKWPQPGSEDAGADAGTGSDKTCPPPDEAKQIFADQGVSIGTIVGDGLFGGTQCCYSTKSADYCEE